MKFNYGYENLKPAPVTIENFRYMDLRSLSLINKLICLAVKNMNKIKSDVNYIFKTQLSVSIWQNQKRKQDYQDIIIHMIIHIADFETC